MHPIGRECTEENLDEKKNDTPQMSKMCTNSATNECKKITSNLTVTCIVLVLFESQSELGGVCGSENKKLECLKFDQFY